MKYEDINELIEDLERLPKKEATKKLTEYYVRTRFGLSTKEFRRGYTDGAYDGGIDFHYKENQTYFIFQTKYLSKDRALSESEITDEIYKIINTLENPNPKNPAIEFVYEIKSQLKNPEAALEVILLTTGKVKDEHINEAQRVLKKISQKYDWKINIEFIPIDNYKLDTIIFDINHGFVPYTGKKEVRIDKYILEENHNIPSITTTIRIGDILKWFKDSSEIDHYIQKNVRGFLGDNKINKEIRKSYRENPTEFWYKHNGIIIFVDDFAIEQGKLILRNPQIVNGAQTIRSLYSEYKKLRNNARILLRVYRLPYENTETYRRGIGIVSALNTQNNILYSDLRSSDPRQVRLEKLFSEIGYKYWRKRVKGMKSRERSITMKNLALIYYVCKRKEPYKGVIGHVEELFSDSKKYDEVFDENRIKEDLSAYHIISEYITAWAIDQIIKKKILRELDDKRDQKLFKFIRFYILAEIYHKLIKWKRMRIDDLQMWNHFILTDGFEDTITKYGRRIFKIAKKMMPRDTDEPRAFYRERKTTKIFFSKVPEFRTFEKKIERCYSKFEEENYA